MTGFLVGVGVLFLAVLIFLAGFVSGIVLGSRAANPPEDRF